MDHHVLVMHPGDKDLITAQITARTERQFSLLKPNAARNTCGQPRKSWRSSRCPARWKVISSAHTLELFTEQENVALVATDVVACGIHVDGISLVVHVDAPRDHKAYLHRSGRTSRAG